MSRISIITTLTAALLVAPETSRARSLYEPAPSSSDPGRTNFYQTQPTRQAPAAPEQLAVGIGYRLVGIVRTTLLVQNGDDLLAIDTSSGKQHWSVRGDLLAYSRRLAFLKTNQTGVRAVNLQNGKEQWATDLVGHEQIAGDEAGIDENGMLFLPCQDGQLVALKTADGTVAWEQPVGTSVAGVSANGGLVVVATRPQFEGRPRVLAFDAVTGARRWSWAAPGLRGAATTPVVYDGRVYFSAWQQTQDGDSSWLYSLRAQDGSVDWKTEGTMAHQFAGVLGVVGSLLLSPTDSGRKSELLLGFDRQTGKKLWSTDAHCRVGFLAYEMVVCVGVEEIVARGLDSGRLLWRIKGRFNGALPSEERILASRSDAKTDEIVVLRAPSKK